MNYLQRCKNRLQEFRRSLQKNERLKLIVNPALGILANGEEAYSCTIDAKEEDDYCPGCAANFLVAVAEFSLKEVVRRFKELQEKKWGDLDKSMKEASVAIVTRNNGEIPEDLRED